MCLVALRYDEKVSIIRIFNAGLQFLIAISIIRHTIIPAIYSGLKQKKRKMKEFFRHTNTTTYIFEREGWHLPASTTHSPVPEIGIGEY